MKNRKWLAGGMGIGFVICCALALAAVPGIFTTVNATSGYLLNGAGGSSGQALCSDATYYDTPCTVPVTVGTAGTYAYPTSVTTNVFGQVSAITAGTFTGASGYQVLSDGLIIQWGNTGNIANDTPTGVTFPLAFPTAALSVTCSDTFASSLSATWSCYSPTTTGFTGRPDGNHATANYFAIGY